MSSFAPPLPVAEERPSLHPSFVSSLRGIWLFTWRAQLTWKRFPLAILVLLALPALVYLTTLPPKAWQERPSWAPSPATQVDGLARRLARFKLKLKPDQRTALLQIYMEEYQQANEGMGDAQPSEATANEQTERLKSCYDKISSRAQTVLDDRQFVQFKTFNKRKLDESLSRLNERTWGRTGPFYHWLIDFYFLILLPLNCARACGGLIRDELQANTLGFLITRPLSRAKLLIAKYLSQTALLQAAVLVEALLLFEAAHLREVPPLGALLPLFLGAQFLAVQAWSALGALLGQITKRYMAAALVYGFIVELGIGNIPTNINSLSLMRHLKTLLGHNPALQNIYEWPAQGILLPIGALALATILFTGLAAVIFSIKEYHHAAEMQK